MKRTVVVLSVVLASVLFLSWHSAKDSGAEVDAQMQYVDVLRGLIGRKCHPGSLEGETRLRFWPGGSYELVRVGSDYAEVRNERESVFLALGSLRTSVAK